jgi:peptidyl-prolyl cis-trans isomerase SurA
MKASHRYGIILTILLILLAEVSLAKNVNRIVAKVNDEIITYFELSQTALPLLDRLKEAYSGEVLDKKLKEGQSYVLNQMIDMKLIQQQAKKFGIEVNDQDAERQIEDIRQKQNLTKEQLELALSREGLSLEEYRSEVKKRILTTRYVEQLVRKRIKVNEEKLRNYYQQNRTHFRPKNGGLVRVSDLFLAYPDDPEKALGDVREKGEELLKRLQKGEDFAELARKYSQSSTASDGGDLGFLKLGEMLPQFQEAIAKLTTGQISGIIQTPKGLHILKLNEESGTQPPPFEEVKDQVYNAFMAEEQEKAMKTITSEVRENAFIELML